MIPLSPQQAAAELLRRREARRSFVAYNRFIAEAEADGEVEPEYPAQHHILLCEALQSLADGTELWGEPVRNLLVFMPPGSAKSTYATVRFPAWYLGRFRKRGVISASYNATLAEHFGKKVRNLVASPSHLALFPDCSLSEDTRAKGEWETNSGGFYFATGVGGGVTGRRGDIAIGDDLIKGREDADSEVIRNKTWEWWKADLRTRLKPKTARRVLIGTRWHEDDPSGRLLPSTWDGESGVFDGQDGARWHVICLPAQAGQADILGRKPGEWLWTGWFSPEYWEAEKIAQGPRNWASLYQQTPVPDTGGQFERTWVNWYDPHELPKNLNFYGASDYAVTEKAGDWTEHGGWGIDHEGGLWGVDWYTGQVASGDAIDEFLVLAQRMKRRGNLLAWIGESGVIEKAIGPARDRAMREAKTYIVYELLPTVGDKIARFASFRARAQAGMVYLPKGAAWAERLVQQLCAFPMGKHDDMVDVCGLIGRAVDTLIAARPDPLPEERGVKPFTVPWLTSGDRRAAPSKRF